MFSPPSSSSIQGWVWAYWVMMSSTRLPLCSATEVTMPATSTGWSIDEICDASYAFSTSAGKPR